MIDSLKVTGELDITLYDAAGIVKQNVKVNNIVVSTGKNLLIARLSAAGPQPTHMALGSGSTNTTLADITLATETASTRRVFDTTTTLNNQVTYRTVWPAGAGTSVVREAGIFTASSGGTLFARTTFTEITKGANDILAINWTIKIN